VTGVAVVALSALLVVLSALLVVLSALFVVLSALLVARWKPLTRSRSLNGISSLRSDSARSATPFCTASRSRLTSFAVHVKALASLAPRGSRPSSPPGHPQDSTATAGHEPPHPIAVLGSLPPVARLCSSSLAQCRRGTRPRQRAPRYKSGKAHPDSSDATASAALRPLSIAPWIDDHSV